MDNSYLMALCTFSFTYACMFIVFILFMIVFVSYVYSDGVEEI